MTLDVEHALYLWIKHMEGKHESVNRAMLVAKQRKFEDDLGVPMEEQLEGDGWIPNFKKVYGIKEYHRHVLAQYAPRDHFNFDETGLFALWVISKSLQIDDEF
ncbi:hypothetical protein PISMIDRAFT_20078 [Pisolithus microcarpus 441]|uniref:HTH CENPB-type domain-containing protein n=1 Tax=Pisolithus microcarpus 441 TaxID=765257 RepID=A0A0C9Y9S8_9AGAM|nr:hypothetical protein PISMIDRAFT_20078 [Pisolithus microcarpus 441]